MSRFMINVRSIDGAALGGGLGAVRYLTVPDGVTPAPAHMVGLRAWLAAIMQTFTAGGPGLARGDALCFSNRETSNNTYSRSAIIS